GRPDRPSPSAGLAGVGVAYKLVWALGRSFSGTRQVDEAYRDFMLASLMYVAMGTVADVVPLVDENRVLVHYGLRAFQATHHVGVRALLAQGRVEADSVAAENIAFRIAPLVNAAGRLGAAERALELFLSRDDNEAQELAEWLGRANQERKEIETGMLEASLEQIQELGMDSADPDHPGRPIVVAGEGWHSGVAGIVAARLVERFRRPVFVIAINDGLGRGSGRSLDGFPLTALYDAARPLVVSIGGHALAGGMAIEPDRIDEFRSTLDSVRPYESALAARAVYDAVLKLEEIEPELMRELNFLEPHGHANPMPRFRVDGLRIDGDIRLVGKTEDHVSFLARQDRRRIRAIFFRGAERVRELTSLRNRFSVIAELYLNDFRGTARPELRIVDFGPSPDPLSPDA
ncbi:MAG: DHHA1 domain-containing protein, partial [Planctomycetota bacterium]